MYRVILALVLVALAAPTLIFLAEGETALGVVGIVGTVTVGVSLLVGVPLGFWFAKRGWVKLWQSVLAGGAIGGVFGVAFAVVGQWKLAFNFVPWFAALGCVHTGVFWVLAFWRNRRLVAASPDEAPDASTEDAAR